MPLWPQLRTALVPYVGDRPREPLFPAPEGGVMRDCRNRLAKVFEQAGLAKPKGREWHLFRHTYTAMRLQTLDRGEPVAIWTVKTELGHGSIEQIEDTYGHLQEVRHRLDRVEYRPLEDADVKVRTA